MTFDFYIYTSVFVAAKMIHECTSTRSRHLKLKCPARIQLKIIWLCNAGCMSNLAQASMTHSHSKLKIWFSILYQLSPPVQFMQRAKLLSPGDLSVCSTVCRLVKLHLSNYKHFIRTRNSSLVGWTMHIFKYRASYCIITKTHQLMRLLLLYKWEIV